MRMVNLSPQAQLQIDRDGQLPFTKDWLIGKSITILGRKGTGKSTTLAVLAEELLMEGVPLVLVDPQDEFYTLAQRYDLLVAGRSSHTSLPLDPSKAGALAEFSLTHNLPVVLSLPKYSPEERFTLLRCFFQRLWMLEEDLRKPYFVFLEEAHTYLPQVGTTPVFDILSTIFLLGRKYGLGTIVATQRSQKIHKDSLTQSDTYLLHKVSHPKDIEVYEELVPLPAKEVRAMIARLRKGSAIAVYEDETLPNDVPSDVVTVVQIRNQQTAHVGSTPTFEEFSPVVLRDLDETLLKELQTMLAEAQPGESERERSLLHQIATLQEERTAQDEMIKGLQETLAVQEVQLRELRQQVDLLSNITVTLDGTKIRALELPSIVHLDRMQTHVAQATIEVDRVEGIPSLSTNGTTPTGGPPCEAIRAEETADMSAPIKLLYSEQKLLKRLLEQVQALSPSEKALFTWLLEHDGVEIVSQALADAVSMDIRVTWSRYTHRLLKLPFIARWGVNKFRFQGLFRDYALRHFRSVADPESIAGQLIAAAQS